MELVQEARDFSQQIIEKSNVSLDEMVPLTLIVLQWSFTLFARSTLKH